MHETFMNEAIKLAGQAKDSGDYPFGAVIVKDGRVIATGMSQEQTQNNITKHAELQAVSFACEALSTLDLRECTLYASGEPCNMCASSAFQANINKVFIGATRADLPQFFRKRNIGIYDLAKDASHKIEITTGILNQEAIDLFDGLNKR